MANWRQVLYNMVTIESKKREKEVNQMSREAVERIIGKAVVDSQFREALFADPDRVLGSFELTEEELAALKTIDAETMETLAGTLDERISKADFAGAYLALFGGPQSGELGDVEGWQGLQAV
jgi:hypothetical protein